MKDAVPACLIKKMAYHVEHEADAFCRGGALILVFRRFKRPIDKQRPANNVFSGNETPETTVQAYVTIVAHAEKVVPRNHQFPVLNVLAHHHGPFRIDFALRGSVWKLVAIWVQ